MRHILILVAMIFAPLAAHAEGKKWALLVGVDKYENSKVSPLEFTVRDVKAVSNALIRSAGFDRANVFPMTSDLPNQSPDRPTATKVLQRFRSLASKIGPEDTFVFYFSGHGFSRKEGESEQHFLATVDADPTDLDTLERTTLSTNELRRQMKRIQALKVVFLLDACRNDPTKGAKGESDNKRSQSFSRDLVTVAKSGANGIAGTAIFFACAEGERAWEMPDKKQGAFSYFLVEGIQGKAGNGGSLSMTDLGDYVQQNVKAWGEREDRKQIPELQQFGAAKIVLVERNIPTAGQKNKQGYLTRINPKDGAEMIFVPAGEFEMGDADQKFNPRRTVHVEGYWIYKTPVIVLQYKLFCVQTGTKMPTAPKWGWKDFHPMVNVSWHDAQKYSQWAGVRLPTEAEWEKAARGTDGQRFPWGNEYDETKLVASKRKLGDAMSTAPVHRTDRKSESPYGLIDMAGNIWQWCEDVYKQRRGDAGIRGGSWGLNKPELSRSSYRNAVPPGKRGDNLGFRCAASS